MWITPCKRRTTSLAFFNHPQLIHKYVDKLDNFVNNPICWEKSSRVIHISSTSPNLFYFQSITVNLISEPTFIFPNNSLYFSHFLQNTSVFLQKRGDLAFALCSPLCRLMSIWQTRHHICLRLAFSACCLFSGYCFNRCSMAFMTCVISFVRSTCRLSCISTNPRTFSPLPDNANRCASRSTSSTPLISVWVPKTATE